MKTGFTRLKIWAAFLATLTPQTIAMAEHIPLSVELRKLAERNEAKIGICTLSDGEVTPTCINGNTSFPLQSVMKLVVAAAVLDKVDQKELKLTDHITVFPQHGSPGPQGFVKMVRLRGRYEATVQELIDRAVIDSDSTSVDILIDRLGGVSFVEQFLAGKNIAGITVSRSERELQSDSVGLTWRPEYADNDKFEAAIKALPKETRSNAWRAHLKDFRDTCTPLGMTVFLSRLAAGELLSSASTKHILNVMARTATGPDRLKAGTPKSWMLAHKTGTGRTWNGVTETTNDVGILTAPDGRNVAIAVFVAGSKAPPEQQAAVIADVAELVTNAYGSGEKRGNDGRASRQGTIIR